LNLLPQSRRILLLTSSLAPGGAETVVAQLAMALRTSECVVTVASMLEPAAFVDELRTVGAQVVSLGMRPRRLNLRGIWRFFRYLRHFRPDLIHAHMFHASILARIARLATGIPVVCTIHSEIECSHRKTSANLREWLYRVTDFAASRTTAVSKRVRERYVEKQIVPAHRIEVIDNGVDVERFRPDAEQRSQTRESLLWGGSFVWLAAGRLAIAKDYPNLIEAFHQVHREFPNSRLAIAGEGPLRPTLEEVVAHHGLKSAVSLLGLRADVPQLMNACDAFVMSSAWEGGPLVLLEAAACARPVVSTEVGIAPQIVIPGKTGFLVSPRNSTELTDAMKQIMEMTPEQREYIGEMARLQVVDRFALASVYRRYQNLYEGMLAASS
jgi:glycosyltransferase involved in cell wall biosynthesis